MYTQAFKRRIIVKQKYEIPMAEVAFFQTEDIMTTSGPDTGLEEVDPVE